MYDAECGMLFSFAFLIFFQITLVIERFFLKDVLFKFSKIEEGGLIMAMTMRRGNNF